MTYKNKKKELITNFERKHWEHCFGSDGEGDINNGGGPFYGKEIKTFLSDSLDSIMEDFLTSEDMKDEDDGERGVTSDDQFLAYGRNELRAKLRKWWGK